VAIGGRGNIVGAVLGAAFVSLISSVFTSGQLPNIDLILFKIKWVDWWLPILGVSFVFITLYAPRGIIGILVGRVRIGKSHE